MGNPNDVWICSFRTVRQSRTEIDTSLVFNPKSNTFQIRVSQDYEMQAKIEISYSNADEYFASHEEDRDTAREAINGHMTQNAEYEKGMKLVQSRMKHL